VLLIKLRELLADGTVPRDMVLRIELLKEVRLDGLRRRGLESGFPSRFPLRLVGASSPPGRGRFHVRMLPTEGGMASRVAALSPEHRPRLSLKEECPMLSVELKRLVESRSDITRVIPCRFPLLGDARFTCNRWRSGVYSDVALCSCWLNLANSFSAAQVGCR
jgi:hypothetical protein